MAAGAADVVKPAPQRTKPGGAAKPFIGGSDDGQGIRRKKPTVGQPPAAGKLVPNKRKSAQYNPKELGVDKRK